MSVWLVVAVSGFVFFFFLKCRIQCTYNRIWRFQRILTSKN